MHVVSPIITVTVGNETQPFQVHESLLCERSAYFKSCLKTGTSKESKSKALSFDNEDINAFRCFINWVYCGDCEGSDTLNGIDLVEAYALADRLIAVGFKNHILDITSTRLDDTWTSKEFLEMIVMLVNRGLDDTPLMHFWLHQLAWKMHSSGYGQYLEDENWLYFVSISGQAVTRLMKLLENIKLKHPSKRALPSPASSYNEFWHETCDQQMEDGRPEPAPWCIDFKNDES